MPRGGEAGGGEASSFTEGNELDPGAGEPVREGTFDPLGVAFNVRGGIEPDREGVPPC